MVKLKLRQGGSSPTARAFTRGSLVVYIINADLKSTCTLRPTSPVKSVPRRATTW